MAEKEKPKAKKTSTKKRTKKSPPKDFTYTARDGKKYTMNERQKKFCDLYLQWGAFGTDAYMEAYDVANPRVAAANASRLLTDANIFNYINLMYEEYGFNDDDVLKEHLFLIKQQGDLSSKARGIDMYYKKTGGYAEEKHDLTIRKYEDLSDEEIDAKIDAILNKRRKAAGN